MDEVDGAASSEGGRDADFSADREKSVLGTRAQPTLQTRSACGCMPACVWEQHAVKQAVWMVIQMTAAADVRCMGCV